MMLFSPRCKKTNYSGNNTMMGLGALAAADKFDHMDDKEVHHDQDNESNNQENDNNKNNNNGRPTQ